MIPSVDVAMLPLPYNPGVLPSKPPPAKGESISVSLPGLPPYKQIRASIRNVNHPRYQAFVALREAATEVMGGRAWYSGPVQFDLVVFAPKLHGTCTILDYAGGVMDTIGGSHGFTFTYLPIVYEDDCQVAATGVVRYVPSREERYELTITFL
jgi:hypothetical protein